MLLVTHLFPDGERRKQKPFEPLNNTHEEKKSGLETAREEERLCQRLFFPNKKKVSVFCNGVWPNSKLSFARTNERRHKEQERHLFLRDDFYHRYHRILEQRRQRREKERERAICQHRRFRSGLGKNEKGGKDNSSSSSSSSWTTSLVARSAQS